MDVEIVEIQNFLNAHHPFDLLPTEEISLVAKSIEIRYARKGDVLIAPGDKVAHLYIVRSGAIEIHGSDDALLARLSDGESFGSRSLLRGGKANNHCAAMEDSLVYMLPAEMFDGLRGRVPAFNYFYVPPVDGKLGEAVRAASSQEALSMMTIRVGDMLSRPPVTIGLDATILDAARKMRDERVSCLLINTDDGGLAGIFTDRDLRNRVAAEGMRYDTKLVKVMTANPFRIDVSATAFDALLTMTRHTIRHLPVVRDGDHVAGVLTATNLLTSHTTSPVYLAGDLNKRNTPEGLREVLNHVPELVQHLVQAGAGAYSVGHVVSTLTDGATVRLLKLAEEKLGPPPVPYAWCAAGSQARQEQTALSDQDNCLVLSDDFREDAHGEYFRALAKFVNDGLDICGYVYCPGEMMAMTGQWRQPLAVWKKYFSKWIEEPEPKALMLACIFFDMRIIHGDRDLFGALQKLILEKSQKNRIFQAYMAGNAMTHQPPIGFFRNFVLIRGGDHDHTLDLKHNGVVPITDLARVYALASGIAAVNTFDRLEQAAEAGGLSREGAQDLKDALDLISMTRLHHQAAMIHEGQKADNFVIPNKLSSFERTHLKNAFQVVKTMQTAMASRYRF